MQSMSIYILNKRKENMFHIRENKILHYFVVKHPRDIVLLDYRFDYSIDTM